ncbi:MAG: hypothetical protein ACREQQ_05595, partial [Candidatus Binatia bacterium]
MISRPILGRVLYGALLFLAASTECRAHPGDLAAYVDPLIGTWPPGFVNPGPVVPHGMVGLGPDTEGPLN